MGELVVHVDNLRRLSTQAVEDKSLLVATSLDEGLIRFGSMNMVMMVIVVLSVFHHILKSIGRNRSRSVTTSKLSHCHSIERSGLSKSL